MRDLLTPLYRARLAAGAQDVARAQDLRGLAFRRGLHSDADAYDLRADHLLVETLAGESLATFRIAVFDATDDLRHSYAAQFYDLTRFAAQPGRKAEVGRFCLHPLAEDPDLVRLCWAALARLTFDRNVAHLFGCTSLAGADAQIHAPALAWLAQTALGPASLRPQPRGGAVAMTGGMAGPAPDAKGVPPLLRFYLTLGGWVADHAQIDRDLDTVHVFTALSLTDLTPARAKRLRAVAALGQTAAAPVDAARKAV